MTGIGTMTMLIASAVALAIILALGGIMAAVTWIAVHVADAVESWAHRHCWCWRDVTRFPRWALTRMRRVYVPGDGDLLTPREMRALLAVRRAWKLPAAEPAGQERSDERSES